MVVYQNNGQGLAHDFITLYLSNILYLGIAGYGSLSKEEMVKVVISQKLGEISEHLRAREVQSYKSKHLNYLLQFII